MEVPRRGDHPAVELQPQPGLPRALPLPRARPGAGELAQRGGHRGRHARVPDHHGRGRRGLGGWGTNWVNQSAGVQQWDRFHLDELIPWVDANLNTVRAREGRAVAGFSMGGFVAIRHAAHRPGLFRMAIGMSGGYDLEDQRMRVAVTAPLVEKGLPLDGPFGAPWDGSWGFNNPWHRVGALRGVHTVLYGGTRHDDLLEQQAHRLTYEFHQHLLPTASRTAGWSSTTAGTGSSAPRQRHRP
ncbi:esterase family protein [Saccharothrix sp. MB29]|nr:esterase family protein [Saccharothrix sp. MB29]